jgi:hypothetical protein
LYLHGVWARWEADILYGDFVYFRRWCSILWLSCGAWAHSNVRAGCTLLCILKLLGGGGLFTVFLRTFHFLSCDRDRHLGLNDG